MMGGDDQGYFGKYRLVCNGRAICRGVGIVRSRFVGSLNTLRFGFFLHKGVGRIGFLQMFVGIGCLIFI